MGNYDSTFIIQTNDQLEDLIPTFDSPFPPFQGYKIQREGEQVYYYDSYFVQARAFKNYWWWSENFLNNFFPSRIHFPLQTLQFFRTENKGRVVQPFADSKVRLIEILTLMQTWVKYLNEVNEYEWLAYTRYVEILDSYVYWKMGAKVDPYEEAYLYYNMALLNFTNAITPLEEALTEVTEFLEAAIEMDDPTPGTDNSPETLLGYLATDLGYNINYLKNPSTFLLTLYTERVLIGTQYYYHSPYDVTKNGYQREYDSQQNFTITLPFYVTMRDRASFDEETYVTYLETYGPILACQRRRNGALYPGTTVQYPYRTYPREFRNHDTIKKRSVENIYTVTPNYDLEDYRNTFMRGHLFPPGGNRKDLPQFIQSNINTEETIDLVYEITGTNSTLNVVNIREGFAKFRKSPEYDGFIRSDNYVYDRITKKFDVGVTHVTLISPYQYKVWLESQTSMQVRPNRDTREASVQFFTKTDTVRKDYAYTEKPVTVERMEPARAKTTYPGFLLDPDTALPQSSYQERGRPLGSGNWKVEPVDLYPGASPNFENGSCFHQGAWYEPSQEEIDEGVEPDYYCRRGFTATSYTFSENLDWSYTWPQEEYKVGPPFPVQKYDYYNKAITTGTIDHTLTIEEQVTDKLWYGQARRNPQVWWIWKLKQVGVWHYLDRWDYGIPVSTALGDVNWRTFLSEWEWEVNWYIITWGESGGIYSSQLGEHVNMKPQMVIREVIKEEGYHKEENNIQIAREETHGPINRTPLLLDDIKALRIDWFGNIGNYPDSRLDRIGIPTVYEESYDTEKDDIVMNPFSYYVQTPNYPFLNMFRTPAARTSDEDPITPLYSVEYDVDVRQS